MLPPMRIELITPTPLGATDGNRVTAVRWARILRSLGHRVRVATEWSGTRVDLLVALHAVKSYASIRKFRRVHPRLPLVVCAAGTDVYGAANLERGVAEATRIVVLQPHAVSQLPARLRRRTVVIRQSAAPMPGRVQRVARHFQVAVVANLRQVKDPLRPALAARKLPDASRIHIVMAGAPVSESLAARVEAEVARNPRVSWRGPLAPRRARRLVAASHAVAIPSRDEGGSNVLCESLASRTPVLASDAPGVVATLGEAYPALFPVGDTLALRDLMSAFETDRAFQAQVRKACALLRPLVDPKRERAAWSKLLRDLA